MPWTEQLPNGRYRAFWRDDLGKRHSKSGFTQQAAAGRYAGEQEARSRRGEMASAGRSQTWGQWCDRWLELRRVETSTLEEDRSRVEKYLRPKWGTTRIARIQREHVQEWVNDMTRDGMSAGLTRRVYHTFSASMKAAMLHKRIPANPCSHIELPDPPPAEERYFERSEFDRIIDLMPEPYRTAAVLLVGTGLRFSELAGLHWSRVNFETRMITVQETLGRDGKSIKPWPKSKKPRHVGPFPSWVASALAGLQAARESITDGCGLAHGDGRKRCRSALVLTTRAGTPLDRHNMLRAFRTACKRAGVDAGRTHDLRHTFASWLRHAGIELDVVQELLGHASIVTTQRYTHLAGSKHDAISAALEGAAFAPSAIRPKDVAPILPHDLENGPETETA